MGTSHYRYPVRLEDQQRRLLETMVQSVASLLDLGTGAESG